MDIAISKTCGKCKIPKPTSDYWKGGGPDGLQAYCRDCMREYRKESDNVDENCLYVLSYDYSLGGPFQIGRTACVEARVAQLEASQCASSSSCTHASRSEETGMRGKEWFNCPLATIITAIASHL